MGDKLVGDTDGEKLSYLGNKNYKSQGVWFLNAYWETLGEKNAEDVWTVSCNDVHREDVFTSAL